MKKKSDTRDSVQEIYEYYCRTFGKNPNRYKLLLARRKKINARFDDGFRVEEIKTAISKLSQSAYHVVLGYATLEFVLRNAEKTEEWTYKSMQVIEQQNEMYYRQNPAARKIMAQMNRKDNTASPKKEEIFVPEGYEKLQLGEDLYSTMNIVDREKRIAQIINELKRNPRCKGLEPKTLRDSAIAILKERLVDKTGIGSQGAEKDDRRST